MTQELDNSIITQIALQLTSAHSYGGNGRVGRNENVTGVKAILRISVAKLVFGFCRKLEYGPLLGNLSHFVCYFLSGREGVNFIKKRKKKNR